MLFQSWRSHCSPFVKFYMNASTGKSQVKEELRRYMFTEGHGRSGLHWVRERFLELESSRNRDKNQEDTVEIEVIGGVTKIRVFSSQFQLVSYSELVDFDETTSPNKKQAAYLLQKMSLDSQTKTWGNS